MSDNSGMNFKKININVDISDMMRVINEPFNMMLEESFRFQERRNREYIIEKRKEDIIPGFLRGRKKSLKPVEMAFRDTQKFISNYTTVIVENIKTIGAIQKGTNEIALRDNGNSLEAIEMLIDRKIEERMRGILAILTNGNRDNIS